MELCFRSETTFPVHMSGRVLDMQCRKYVQALMLKPLTFSVPEERRTSELFQPTAPQTQVCSFTLMHNGSVRSSPCIPYLLKHNKAHHSLTVIFLRCLCSLSGKPANGFSHSQNRIFTGNDTFNSALSLSLSLSLSPVLRQWKSLQRNAPTEKGEKK